MCRRSRSERNRSSRKADVNSLNFNLDRTKFLSGSPPVCKSLSRAWSKLDEDKFHPAQWDRKCATPCTTEIRCVKAWGVYSLWRNIHLQHLVGNSLRRWIHHSLYTKPLFAEDRRRSLRVIPVHAYRFTVCFQIVLHRTEVEISLDSKISIGYSSLSYPVPELYK